MRSLPVFGMILMLAMPALAQSQAAHQAAAPAVQSADGHDPSAEFVALRDRLATRNKELTGELGTQRALVKHNQDLLKEAERLDANNRKMEAEKQKLSAQNADLQKHRDALSAAPANTETAALRTGGK